MQDKRQQLDLDDESEWLDYPVVDNLPERTSGVKTGKTGAPQELIKVPVQGFILIQVDDVLDGGSAVHRDQMQRLQKVFRLGNYQSLKTTIGGVFNGRRLRQLPDFAVKLSMEDYILTKVWPIAVSREQKKDKDRVLDAYEFMRLLR